MTFSGLISDTLEEQSCSLHYPFALGDGMMQWSIFLMVPHP
jgi:hypothetical protein